MIHTTHMKPPQLQITYRKGRFLAAYLSLLRRAGDKSVRTLVREPFVVDFAADGRALGIEILGRPRSFLAKLNAVLGEIGLEPLTEEDVAPILPA